MTLLSNVDRAGEPLVAVRRLCEPKWDPYIHSYVGAPLLAKRAGTFSNLLVVTSITWNVPL
jgi:hypothetical protein